MDLGPEVVGELNRDGQDEGDDSDTTPNAQTMKEFFDDDVVSRPAGPDSRAERGTTSNNAPQMSATAYFNRQASMLMLYFPLAVSLNPRVHLWFELTTCDSICWSFQYPSSV
jgi:hypothetical protein